MPINGATVTYWPKLRFEKFEIGCSMKMVQIVLRVSRFKYLLSRVKF